MHPAVAFLLYLAVGSIVILTFLLLCVRVSVFIEDTCPTRFCMKRKQRKMRKTIIRRMLYPDEPDSPRPAPPSDENITADIICQPYIYRDAYSTGLTGLSMLANLPLTLTYVNDVNPGDAIITNSEHMRVTVRRILPQMTPPVSHTEITMAETENEELTIEDSPPPDYLKVTNESLKKSDGESDTMSVNELPPPSYDECTK